MGLVIVGLKGRKKNCSKYKKVQEMKREDKSKSREIITAYGLSCRLIRVFLDQGSDEDKMEIVYVDINEDNKRHGDGDCSDLCGLKEMQVEREEEEVEEEEVEELIALQNTLSKEHCSPGEAVIVAKKHWESFLRKLMKVSKASGMDFWELLEKGTECVDMNGVEDHRKVRGEAVLAARRHFSQLLGFKDDQQQLFDWRNLRSLLTSSRTCLVNWPNGVEYAPAFNINKLTNLALEGMLLVAVRPWGTGEV
jgi:hypothetical protein